MICVDTEHQIFKTEQKIILLEATFVGYAYKSVGRYSTESLHFIHSEII